MASVTSELHFPESPSLCIYDGLSCLSPFTKPLSSLWGKKAAHLSHFLRLLGSDPLIQLQPLHLSVICEVEKALSLTKRPSSQCKTKAVPGVLSSEGSRAPLCLKFPVDSWPVVTQKGTYSLSECLPGSSAESVEPAKSP